MWPLGSAHGTCVYENLCCSPSAQCSGATRKTPALKLGGWATTTTETKFGGTKGVSELKAALPRAEHFGKEGIQEQK